MKRFRRCLGLAALLSWLTHPASAAQPETVYFPSADGRTELVGYLFMPQTPSPAPSTAQSPGPAPAIVMLHGRAGPYSSNVNADCGLVARAAPTSPCNAAGLSKRHMMWGSYWADRGIIALLPDSFGPRGKGNGFARFTHDDPARADVNEKTVRPLDAEGALAYLRGRRDVIPDRIALQGWSNGGSTTLNVLIRQGSKPNGFRNALVFYPGCGPEALLDSTLVSPVPTALFLAADDEEVSPVTCQRMAARSQQAGTRIDTIVYPGASHDFDEPSASRQAIPGNGPAMSDAMNRAGALVESLRR